MQGHAPWAFFAAWAISLKGKYRHGAWGGTSRGMVMSFATRIKIFSNGSNALVCSYTNLIRVALFEYRIYIYIRVLGSFRAPMGLHLLIVLVCLRVVTFIYPVPIYTKDILNHTCFHPWQPSHLKHEPTNLQRMSTHIHTHICFLPKPWEGLYFPYCP